MKNVISTDLWVWLAAIFTIICISYLYRDNPFWKFAESTVVGATTGHWVVMGLQALRISGFERIAKGYYSLIIPILVGFLFFARYSKKYTWLYRYAAALIVGIGTGTAVRMVPRAQILAQMQATILPLVGVDPVKALSNLLLVILVIGGVVNFVFTRYTENRVTSTLRDVGRYGLFVAFGSMYSAIILTYISSLIGQLQLLLLTWLGLGS